MAGLELALLLTYALLIGLVSVYGLHRYWLIYLFYRHAQRNAELKACFVDWPTVTVQLPMFNEPQVATRIIDAACNLEYPKDRLQIQVLDDSTDQTPELVRAAVARWRAAGFDIAHLHRTDRQGFKAGALANGLKTARGEFVAIFDADFIPPPNVLKLAVHHFADPTVGVVQTRWEHLNRANSVLTESQAILLDGHFVVEHTARSGTGRFISFNGTAGLWRVAAIRDAGGWHHDTLTEDLDLSYRAQMKGWRFVYLPELTSPAELPADMLAYKAQQYRWTKGGVQVLRKMFWPVMRSPLPLKIKVEAFFHLTSPLVYLYVLGLTLLLYPCIVFRFMIFADRPIWQFFIDLGLFSIATLSASTFYLVGQREIRHSVADKCRYLPFIIALGIGMAFNNARAAVDGLRSAGGEFVRTPKRGATTSDLATLRQRRQIYQALGEILIGVYLTLCVLASLTDDRFGPGIIFIALFMGGYFYVGGLTLLELFRPNAQPSPTGDIEPAANSALMTSAEPSAAHHPVQVP